MEQDEIKTCGIIMPISLIDGCCEKHWGDVFSIIEDVITDIKFKPNLVSDADDSGVIHKRIIQNIYENPIVVCDVSANNPNVMFELGMRLAFDKPTIIIKDNKTKYCFDTSSIEHIEYPRDLRFTDMIRFKKKLKEKILSTYKNSQEDPEYSTFLKHFGTFQTAKIETKEVTSELLILEEIKLLRSSMSRLESKTDSSLHNKVGQPSQHSKIFMLDFYGQGIDQDMAQSAVHVPHVVRTEICNFPSGEAYLRVYSAGTTEDMITSLITKRYPNLSTLPF